MIFFTKHLSETSMEASNSEMSVMRTEESVAM